ncbi:DUF4446 family protein [Heliobacterium mobile]|uniref:DUF4446 family protein n=1 Tax=Heliobacterium mobile TaxID=28064 RepID=UPI0014786A62|nr:DUF4446 family protein [Heliobacterium mobile]
MPVYLPWITENINGLVVTSLGLTLISTVLLIFIYQRFRKITAMYGDLMKGQEGRNLEELLLENQRVNMEASQRLTQLETAVTKLETESEEMVRHIGIVRFNAFENVGSDQSFSVALLNNHYNGVVISSLYGRELSQVYAKPIQKGKSTYLLTKEEEEALAKAINK